MINRIRRTNYLAVSLLALNYISPVAIAAAPSTPVFVYVTAGTTGAFEQGTISTKWSAVTNATSYVVRVRDVEANVSNEYIARNNSTIEMTVNGLKGGTTYAVSIQSVDVSTPSTWSSAVSVVPKTDPGIPNKPVALAGVNKATVSWTLVPASRNGGYPITGYKVTEINTAKTVTVGGDVNSTDVIDLTPSASAEFTVTAINASSASGTTSAKSDAVTIPTVPSTMPALVLTSTANANQLKASWSANGSNGGNAITSYRLYLYRTGTEVTRKDISDTSQVEELFSSVALGTYTVKISSINGVGESSLSPASNEIEIVAADSGGSSGGSSGGGGGSSGGGGGGGGGSTSPSASPSPKPSGSPKPSASPKPTVKPTKKATPSPSATVPPSIAKELKKNSVAVLPMDTFSSEFVLVKDVRISQSIQDGFQPAVPAAKKGEKVSLILVLPNGKKITAFTGKVLKSGKYVFPPLELKKPGSYKFQLLVGKNSIRVEIQAKK